MSHSANHSTPAIAGSLDGTGIRRESRADVRMVTSIPIAAGMVACAMAAAVAMSVRADAPPGHFTDLADGTVRDNVTGLVWQQSFSASGRSQAFSLTYCTGLGLSGGGWRLPTVLELASIVDETRATAVVDPAFFPGVSTELFWSATTAAPSNGWYVDFANGSAYNQPASWGTPFARCVR